MCKQHLKYINVSIKMTISKAFIRKVRPNKVPCNSDDR